MKKQTCRMLVAVVLVAGLCEITVAQSTAELLEKGIYVEETVGDVDKAIAIYERIVEDAHAARPHAAQAYYRLGLCYQKKGKHKEALSTFDKLIVRYPEQKTVIARARKRLADSRLELDPGEVRSIVKKAVMTISTCAETDPRVKESLSTLDGLNAQTVAGELAAYLGEERKTVRRSAVYILWKAELDTVEPAVKGLMAHCSHQEDLTRGMAALALGGRRVGSSYETLCDMAIEDESGFARRCAAYALGLMGRAEARTVLEKALKDSDPLVANNAEAALTMLGFDKAAAQPSGRKPSYSQTHRFEVQADGTGSHTSESSSTNRGKQPMKTYSFINSNNDIVKVLDEDDNELKFTVRKRGSHYAYSVTRVKPVPPGAKFSSKIVTKGKSLARKRADAWVYQRNHTPCPETAYTETVVLPADALVLTSEPAATRVTTENGRPVLRFEKNLKKNEAFRCRITYRLPGDAAGAGAAAMPGDMEEVGYGDGTPDGKKSLGGSGHAVAFDRPDAARFVEGVKIHAARYGYPKPPEEDFDLYVLDGEFQVLAKVPFAYGLIERGDLDWYELRTPSVEVPKTFHVALSFRPQRTKGIYLGYDNSAGKSRSFTGLPGAGFSPVGQGYEWMVRPLLAEKPSGAKGVIRLAEREPPAVEADAGKAGDDLQVLIDAARPGSVVNVPKGTYRKPLRIDKALTLKGSAREACVLEVTADEPAVLVTTKKPVALESLTVKWQRATSARTAEPVCAVVLKDAKATIRDCRVLAPGGNTRCPAAVLAYGFSDLHMDGCRLEGYEFTVQFARGAEGVVENCVFVKPGHCGITVSSDSKATIRRNVVTGSGYHAIRCTGGELEVSDNLIIKNKNRGLYLGNKSARGSVRNNVIIGNGTGISGFANSEVDIENNVILDSGYAGVDFRQSCELSVKNNILSGNARGIVQFKEGGRGGTVVGSNTLWNNKTATEGVDKTGKMVASDPGFKDAANGDFSATAASVRGAKHGLKDSAPFVELWHKWKAAEKE